MAPELFWKALGENFWCDWRKEKGSHAYSLISIMPTAGFASSNISESKYHQFWVFEKNQN
jgi:hypothetical protein